MNVRYKHTPDKGDTMVFLRQKDFKEFDKENSALIMDLCEPHKDKIIAIISDPEPVRKALCEGQEALSKANDHTMVLLDHLDRLELAYRSVFPDIKECIHGEKGCPRDSIVFCTACTTPNAKGVAEKEVA